MDAVLTVLALLVVVTLVGVVARRLPLPEPILLMAAGLALGIWEPLPRVRLEPGVFFALFLPPLLYADGWLTNLREFRAALRPILLLSIGLVVFTTVAVGYAVHFLIPAIPLPVAFALGAIVSPTDAVAVAAITEKLRVPIRLSTIVNGESLVNDATGLVAFKFALAAIAAGSFELGSAVVDFVRVAGGGLALGLAVGWLSSQIRRRLETFGDSDANLEVTLSLLTPFAAYLPADLLGLSGVMAAAAAGLYNGWTDPIHMSAQTRTTAWGAWSIALFLLNGLVFLLLGLELPRIADELAGEWWTALVLYALIVSALVIVLRILWVFPGAYLPRWLFPSIRRREPDPGWRAIFIVSWSGLRGAVTLAAALSIPLALPGGEPFPGRAYVIFLAASVIVATLLVQGLSLPWLICRLGVQADGRLVEEEQSARLEILRAGLERLGGEADSLAAERGESHTEPAVALEAAARLAAELEERIERIAGDADERSPPERAPAARASAARRDSGRAARATDRALLRAPDQRRHPAQPAERARPRRGSAARGLAQSGAAAEDQPVLGGGRSRATTTDSKPQRACVPSQNGLLSDWPQRQSETTARPPRPNARPAPSTISSTSPAASSTRSEPESRTTIFIGRPAAVGRSLGGRAPGSRVVGLEAAVEDEGIEVGVVAGAGHGIRAESLVGVARDHDRQVTGGERTVGGRGLRAAIVVVVGDQPGTGVGRIERAWRAVGVLVEIEHRVERRAAAAQARRQLCRRRRVVEDQLVDVEADGAADRRGEAGALEEVRALERQVGTGEGAAAQPTPLRFGARRAGDQQRERQPEADAEAGRAAEGATIAAR